MEARILKLDPVEEIDLQFNSRLKIKKDNREFWVSVKNIRTKIWHLERRSMFSKKKELVTTVWLDLVDDDGNKSTITLNHPIKTGSENNAYIMPKETPIRMDHIKK
jgi:hypothetical protein